jgi:hypothetical protein
MGHGNSFARMNRMCARSFSWFVMRRLRWRTPVSFGRLDVSELFSRVILRRTADRRRLEAIISQYPAGKRSLRISSDADQRDQIENLLRNTGSARSWSRRYGRKQR